MVLEVGARGYVFALSSCCFMIIVVSQITNPEEGDSAGIIVVFLEFIRKKITDLLGDFFGFTWKLISELHMISLTT